ncbi:hypothetical protein H9P43_002383 [Blastocladiella emersonii ATCC 22665]|nr:hypothetical protein H9P43_002383 [Blastocladiella emersonii ATCC 22665]
MPKQQQAQSDAADHVKRPRIFQACDECRRRKSKCDGQLPCKHCSANARQCQYATNSKRKSRNAPKSSESLARCADPNALLLNGNGSADASAAEGSSRSSPFSGTESSPDPAPSSSSSSTAVVPTTFQVRASPPASSGRADIDQHDIDELSDNLLFIVQLDGDGRAKSFANLGPSNGISTLRAWSQTLSEGAIHHIHNAPSATREARRELKLFPPRPLVDMLLGVYFDSMHRWVPIVDRAAVDAELASPTPNYLYLYSILAIGALHHEVTNGLTVTNTPVLLSWVFAERAKTRLMPIGSANLLSIESLQGMALLAYYSMNLHGNASWSILGIAARGAIDMGLNHNPTANHFLRGRVCVPTWALTMAAIYSLDRFEALVKGRPIMLQDTDCCFVTGNEFLRTRENEARYDASRLLEPDHYFVWSLRLAEITGKVSTTLNSIAHRRDLPFSLPFLHGLLTAFRAQLPARLQFNPAEPDPVTRIQAATINLRYYGLVVSLYRPLLSGRAATLIDSPLKQQYLSLLEGTFCAMITILESTRADLTHYSNMLMHELIVILSVAVVLVTHDHSAGRSTSRSVIEYLDRLYAFVAQASAVWPFMTRPARIVLDIRASIQQEALDTSALDEQLNLSAVRYNGQIEAVTDLFESPPDAQQLAVARLSTWYLDMRRASLHAATAAPSAASAAAAMAAMRPGVVPARVPLSVGQPGTTNGPMFNCHAPPSPPLERQRHNDPLPPGPLTFGQPAPAAATVLPGLAAPIPGGFTAPFVSLPSIPDVLTASDLASILGTSTSTSTSTPGGGGWSEATSAAASPVPFGLGLDTMLLGETTTGATPVPQLDFDAFLASIESGNVYMPQGT